LFEFYRCEVATCKCHYTTGTNQKAPGAPKLFEIKSAPVPIDDSDPIDGWAYPGKLPTFNMHAAQNGVVMRELGGFKLLPSMPYQQWCKWQVDGKDCAKPCIQWKHPRRDARWFCKEHYRMEVLRDLRDRAAKRRRARGAHIKSEGPPPEVRAKLSAARLAYFKRIGGYSLETRARISASKKGKRLGNHIDQIGRDESTH
jgi:hypothetical protein